MIFIALACWTCRKDKDETAPIVRILAPAAGQVLAVPDTITVSVEVSDDRIVEGLVIDLLDTQGIPVTPSITVTVNAERATVVRDLVVVNERLPSGTYTLAARASDGTNDGRGFQDIDLLEAPLRLRAVFLAPPFSTDPSAILRLDSAGVLSEFLTVQDLNGVAVDGASQHLMVAGSQFAPFQAVPTATGSMTWQVSAPSSDAPEQFTALTVDPLDGRTYFSTRDGFIRGFTGEGMQQFTAQCLPGHRCEAVVVLGDRIATWQRAIVGAAQVMVTYTIAGTTQATLPVEHELISIHRRTTGSVLFFGNAEGIGTVESINIDAGGSPELRSFEEGPIKAVARLDAAVFVIALPGRLVRFDHTTNTVSELIAGIAVEALAFDPATGALFASQGDLLHTIDPNTGTLTDTRGTGMNIGHVLPLRNR